MPWVLVAYYYEPSLFEREVNVFIHESEVEESVTITDEGHHKRDFKKVKIAEAGLPTMISKIYQMHFFLMGDLSFITNFDYLEMREKILWSVAFIPWVPL